MSAVREVAPTLGIAPACDALGIPRASFYRHSKPEPLGPPKPRPRPDRALSTEERMTVLATLHEPRFADQAPAEVYARLLDEDRYLCSERTMYRILEENDEVRERRNQLRHPNYSKPELMATAPNQLWSWDITKLRGAMKWTYFHLYVILDVFSRYVVGWMVAPHESAILAERLIEETCARQGIARGTLTLHADRGSSMKSKSVALLLADLDVKKTHSRPHVSDDNPFSEAQFKTLKYRPDFPARFGSIEDARAFCRRFFDWYNGEHRHSSLGLHTPQDVHLGLADRRNVARSVVLATAYRSHPERFVRGIPAPAEVPKAVWINKPVASAAASRADSEAIRAIPRAVETPNNSPRSAETAGGITQSFSQTHPVEALL